MQPQIAVVRREPFTFTGTTRECFGTWIVNVLYRFSVELMHKAGRDPAAIARFFELPARQARRQWRN